MSTLFAHNYRRALVRAGAPTGGGGGGGGEPTAWVDRSFESYANTAALVADSANWIEILNEADQSIVFTNPPPGGTRSLRCSWPADPDGCYDRGCGRGFSFPSNTFEAWIRVQVRYDSHFTTHNSACGQNDHKLLFLQVNDGNFRSSFHAGWGTHVSKNFLFEVAGSANGNLGAQGISPNWGNVTNTVWDGAWHTIEWYHRHPSDDTTADGRFKLWIDDVLQRNETYQSANLVTANARIPMKALLMCRNKNDGTTNTEMSMYWGRAQVWNTSPGWDIS